MVAKGPGRKKFGSAGAPDGRGGRALRGDRRSALVPAPVSPTPSIGVAWLGLAPCLTLRIEQNPSGFQMAFKEGGRECGASIRRSTTFGSAPCSSSRSAISAYPNNAAEILRIR